MGENSFGRSPQSSMSIGMGDFFEIVAMAMAIGCNHSFGNDF